MRHDECDTVQVLLALRPADRNAAEQGRVETHLTSCASCTSLARTYAAQDRLLRTMPPAALGAAQRQQLSARLESAGRSQRARGRLSSTLGVAAGAAAILAILLLTALAFWQGGVFPGSVEASPAPASTLGLALTPGMTASPAVTPQQQSQSTAAPAESGWVDLVAPVTGDRVSSPIRFSGRTNMTPLDRRVIVRLYDQDWRVLAEATVVIQGEVGAPGTFNGALLSSGYSGPASIVVICAAGDEDALRDPTSWHSGTGARGAESLTSVTIVGAP